MPLKSVFYSFSTNDLGLEVIAHSHHKSLKAFAEQAQKAYCQIVVNVNEEMLHTKSHSRDDFQIVCCSLTMNQDQMLTGKLSHGPALDTGRTCGLVVWELWFFAYFH